MHSVPWFINPWLAMFPVLGTLHEIYCELDNEISQWALKSQFNCPEGCGLCCTNFEPRVGQAEALYLACYYISQSSQCLESLKSLKEVPPCFFYDPEPGPAKGHCSVYPGRPLICRLFGFSASRNKQQQLVFRLCKIMHQNEERQFTEEILKERFKILPPEMGRYSSQVNTLSPDLNWESMPLKQAVEKAIAHLYLKQKYLGLEGSPHIESSKEDFIA
ncbi:MAG: YkgJ family cysteine cluster protein [Spirochaetales bacterium]|nr:YkgJ family cysteine cluster protein [Spirochaetales bacterium]